MQQIPIDSANLPIQTEQVTMAIQPQKLNTTEIRRLGNTQIILGVTTSLLCIISIEKATIQNHITVINYVGVSYGVWIVIAGVIGIMSSKHPSIKIWYRANMGFNVFSAIASFAFVVLYVASIILSLGGKNSLIFILISVSLAILMVVEFLISLTISVDCFKDCGCCSQDTFLRPLPPVIPGATQININSGYVTFDDEPYFGTIRPPPYGSSSIVRLDSQQSSMGASGGRGLDTNYSEHQQQQQQDLNTSAPPPYTP